MQPKKYPTPTPTPTTSPPHTGPPAGPRAPEPRLVAQTRLQSGVLAPDPGLPLGGGLTFARVSTGPRGKAQRLDKPLRSPSVSRTGPRADTPQYPGNHQNRCSKADPIYRISHSQTTRTSTQSELSTRCPHKLCLRQSAGNRPTSRADIIQQDPLRIDAPAWVRYNTSPQARTGAIP